MSDKLVCLDLTKKEKYAIESGKNIKMRWICNNDVFEMIFTVIGRSDDKDNIVNYQQTKYFYKNAMVDGISSKTLKEKKDMGIVSNISFHKLILILRRNGYQIISPSIPEK